MCDIEDEMRESSQEPGKGWADWQAKHGRTSGQQPIIEIRKGNDGVTREYCTTCHWGWPVGSKMQDQRHQNGCIRVPTSQLGRPRR